MPEEHAHLIKCATAKEFIEKLQPTDPRWDRSGLDSDWLFRGQTDSRWPLIPSAWRSKGKGRSDDAIQFRPLIAKSKRFENLLVSYADIDRPPFALEPASRDEWRKLDKGIRRERIRAYIEQILVEVKSIKDFLLIANDVGHLVDPPEWIGHRMNSIIAMTQGGGRERFFEHPLYATSQHHGLPTRLLDWTLHPLVAAYFAAEGTSPEASESIAVWALHRGAVRRCPLREYHVPRHQLPFLHAQSGCFVWNADASQHFALHGEWPTQESVIGESENAFVGPLPAKPWLYKLTVPTSELANVIALLWRARISRAT